MSLQAQQSLGEEIAALGAAIGLGACFLLGLRCWVRWILRFGPRKLKRLNTSIELQQQELEATRIEMLKWSLGPNVTDAVTNNDRIEARLRALKERSTILADRLEAAAHMAAFWSADNE